MGVSRLIAATQMTLFEEELAPSFKPDFSNFDVVACQVSGGRDSVAMVLHILEMGCPPEKLLLMHQLVDGKEEEYTFDWSCMTRYVQLFAQRFNLRLEFQWRRGGILREVLKQNELSQPVCFEHNGQITELPPSDRAKPNTRMKWPSKTADMRTRWCSGFAKMDVTSRTIPAHPELCNKSILFCSGERWSESAARAKRLEVETHKVSSKKRPVTHWRPIISWSEREVWEMLRCHKVLPAIPYLLGFHRTSCLACVFNGPSEWATIEQIFPERLEKIAKLEEKLNFTIDQKESVRELAARGKTRLPVNHPMYSKWLQWAQKPETLQLEDMTWHEWETPAGAYVKYSSGGAP